VEGKRDVAKDSDDEGEEEEDEEDDEPLPGASEPLLISFLISA
jgi:hypothetical protein